MADNQVIQIAPPKIVQKGAASSKIVGMMAVAALLSVIGAEIRATEKTSESKILSSPFLVLFGATSATAIFVLLADFGGTTGETVGVGLAGLVLITSAFIEAGPVWSALAKLYNPSKTTTKASGK